MKIEYLLSFKDNSEVQQLDKNSYNYFVKLFGLNQIKKFNNLINKKTKNTNARDLKKMTNNKFTLLLNKITENNFNNIIIEFIQTFYELSQLDFNIFIETTFIKLIKDTKFQKIIFNFYNKISKIYINKFNLNEKHLINILENYYSKIYLNIELQDKYIFLNKYILEENRINFLNLINYMISKDILNSSLNDIISNTLCESDYILDIYRWFKPKKNQNKYLNIIKTKMNNKLTKREKILITSLLGKTSEESISEESINEESINEESISEESINEESISEESINEESKIEIINMIEEYLLLEDTTDIFDYLENNSSDTIIMFFNELINLYFQNSITKLECYKIIFHKILNYIKIDIIKEEINKLIDNGILLDYINSKIKLNKLNKILKIT